MTRDKLPNIELKFCNFITMICILGLGLGHQHLLANNNLYHPQVSIGTHLYENNRYLSPLFSIEHQYIRPSGLSTSKVIRYRQISHQKKTQHLPRIGLGIGKYGPNLNNWRAYGFLEALLHLESTPKPSLKCRIGGIRRINEQVASTIEISHQFINNKAKLIGETQISLGLCLIREKHPERPKKYINWFRLRKRDIQRQQ